MERENRRVSMTKRLLKEGLLQLLETQKPENIRITELCELSGVNRATFYRHYALPKDLLAEIETDLTEELQKISPLPKSLDAVEAFMESYCTCLQEHAACVQTLLRCGCVHKLQELVSRFCESLVYGECAASGRTEGLCTQMMIAFMAGGICLVLRKWIQEDERQRPKEIAGFVANLLRQESAFAET